MITRSQSAPKPLTEVRSAGQPRIQRSRTTMFAPLETETQVVSPLETREDPFNLGGFFPRTEGWDWIRAESPDREHEDEEDDVEEDFSVPPTPGYEQDDEQEYDEFAREVIDGEDKFGMLAFSSENFPSLLRSKMPVFERGMSPVHVSSLAMDEPSDLDALHSLLCSRRTMMTDPGEQGEIGALFLGGEVENSEKTDAEGWAQTVLAAVVAGAMGIYSAILR